MGSSPSSYLDPGVHLFLLLQALLHPLFLLLFLLHLPGGWRELCRLLRAAPLQRRVHAGSQTLPAGSQSARWNLSAPRAASPQPGRSGRAVLPPGCAAPRVPSGGGSGCDRPLSAAARSTGRPLRPGRRIVCPSPDALSQKAQCPGVPAMTTRRGAALWLTSPRLGRLL